MVENSSGDTRGVRLGIVAKMRVVMLCKALVVASYRSKIRDIAALGVDVRAIVPYSWKEAGSFIDFEPDAVTDNRISKTRIAWNGHFHLHYYPALDRIVGSLRPDIVHIDEEPYNLASFLAARSATRIGAKSLFFSWQNIPRTYPPPFHQFERYLYRRTSYALAGSQEAMYILRDKGYRGPARVIPQFGVDVQTFRPARKATRQFTVGYVGRLVPEKGVEDLIAAFRYLPTESQLLIIGDGPLAGLVESTGSDPQMQGRLQRLSRVPSNQIPALLSRLDVLVLPSRTTTRWKEQFGRILVEAMAAGVAVVGSDSGEIPNVIGDAGRIFHEGDLEELRRVLEELSSSPHLLESMKEKAHHRAVQHFSQQSVAAKTVEVYQQIMSKW